MTGSTKTHNQILDLHKRCNDISNAIDQLNNGKIAHVDMTIGSKHIGFNDLYKTDINNLAIFLDSYRDYLRFTELSMKTKGL